MKLFLKAFIVICLVSSCSKSSKQKVEKWPHLLIYHGDFYPSFIPASKFDVAVRNREGKIKLGVYHYVDTTEVVSFIDSAALTKDDIQYFLTKLDGVPLLKMKSPEYPAGFDGITVYSTVALENSNNEFKFWSPRKKGNPQEHKLVEAIIGLSRRKFVDLNQQEYFESLEQYFDFGLPCKITNTTPFEVRIYGHLSSSDEQELNKFVNSLPIDRPILIDATNFGGMGTMFYPLFKNFIHRNPNTVWVTRPKGYALEQVQEIGVARDRIVNSVVDGKALVSHLSL